MCDLSKLRYDTGQFYGYFKSLSLFVATILENYFVIFCSSNTQFWAFIHKFINEISSFLHNLMWINLMDTVTLRETMTAVIF